MLTSLGHQLPDTVRSARMTSTPWAHAYLSETWPPGVARNLSRSFGGFELTRCERTEHEKSYRFGTAELGTPGTKLPSPEWSSVVDVLCGTEYRDAVSELTGVSLAASRFTLSVWEYGTGDWLAPHVDKPDKIVTQIFYLTEDWQDSDAGRLLILENADVSSVVHALPPCLGASAILVRSERSWHAVEPPARPGGRRRSITATFWR